MAIGTLADIYADQGDAEALRRLLTELRPLFGAVPKAKTAKIVRGIIETIARVPGSGQLQVCAPPELLLLACTHAYACVHSSHCSMARTSRGGMKVLAVGSVRQPAQYLDPLVDSSEEADARMQQIPEPMPSWLRSECCTANV